MISAVSCHKSCSSFALYHVSSFSIDMGVVVVATESGATLVLWSISINIGVVVVLTVFFTTSMLNRPLVSIVSSRDTSHRSVLFQIISSSGCAASKFSTLVAGRIWCLVILVILDPKNTFFVIRISTHLVHFRDELEESSCHDIVFWWLTQGNFLPSSFITLVQNELHYWFLVGNTYEISWITPDCGRDNTVLEVRARDGSILYDNRASWAIAGRYVQSNKVVDDS